MEEARRIVDETKQVRIAVGEEQEGEIGEDL